MKNITLFSLAFAIFVVGNGITMQATSNTDEVIFSLDLLVKRRYKESQSIETLRKQCPELMAYLPDNCSPELRVLIDYIAISGTPVILKFYANWCGPCNRLNPIVEQVATHFGNKICIITINVDTYPRFRSLFNVMYIPTLIYFNNCKEVTRTNSITAEDMIKLIEDMM